MSHHFVQGLKLAAALLAPVVTTLFFRARALASAPSDASRADAHVRRTHMLDRDA